MNKVILLFLFLGINTLLSEDLRIVYKGLQQPPNDGETFDYMVSAAPDECIALVSNKLMCRLIATTDGGRTWERIYDETWMDGEPPSEFPVPAVAFDIAHPSKDHIFVTYEQAVIKRSRDRGKTWDTFRLKENVKNYIDHISMLDTAKGISTFDRHQFAFTQNAWDDFELLSLPDTNWFVKNVKMLNDTSFLLTAYSVIDKSHAIVLLSKDLGKTYKITLVNLDEVIYDFKSPKLEANQGEVYLESIYFLNDTLGWIAGGVTTGLGDTETDIIYKTTDGGVTWSILYKQLMDWRFGLQDIAFIDEMNGVAVGQFHKIIRTSDGGETWVQEFLEDYDPNSSLDPRMRICNMGGRFLISGYCDLYMYPSQIPLSIAAEAPKQAALYPNPASEKLFISSEIDMFSQSIEIYNSLGVLVTALAPSAEIDISYLSPGAYYLKIGNYIQSFVKR